jgi:hypothetical protein
MVNEDMVGRLLADFDTDAKYKDYKTLYDTSYSHLGKESFIKSYVAPRVAAKRLDDLKADPMRQNVA